MSAIPTFFMLPLRDFGFVSLSTCRVTGAGLMLDATSALAAASLANESAEELKIRFACKLCLLGRADTLMPDVKRGCQFAKLYTNSVSTDVVPRLLKESEIKERLRRLDGWKRQKSFISKEFDFRNFMEGIAFINRVAKVAEEQEHHPDIHVRYTKVRLSVQTHSEGGVTRWDFELASAIEGALTSKPSS